MPTQEQSVTWATNVHGGRVTHVAQARLQGNDPTFDTTVSTFGRPIIWSNNVRLWSTLHLADRVPTWIASDSTQQHLHLSTNHLSQQRAHSHGQPLGTTTSAFGRRPRFWHNNAHTCTNLHRPHLNRRSFGATRPPLDNRQLDAIAPALRQPIIGAMTSHVWTVNHLAY